jgi:hypothetical protein
MSTGLGAKETLKAAMLGLPFPPPPQDIRGKTMKTATNRTAAFFIELASLIKLSSDRQSSDLI